MDITQLQLPTGRGGYSPPGTYQSPRVATYGETLTRNDKYAATAAGRVCIAASATGGIALIVAATTGNHPTLWNPAGSGRNYNICKLLLGYVSGNNAPGSLAWNITTAAGAAIATGAPIVTFTTVAVQSALAGGKLDSTAQWSPAVSTYTVAPAFYRLIGLSLFTGIAATAVAPFQMEEKYDGDFVLAPGCALSLVTQQATTTSLFRVAVIFEEIEQ